MYSCLICSSPPAGYIWLLVCLLHSRSYLIACERDTVINPELAPVDTSHLHSTSAVANNSIPSIFSSLHELFIYRRGTGFFQSSSLPGVLLRPFCIPLLDADREHLCVGGESCSPFGIRRRSRGFCWNRDRPFGARSPPPLRLNAFA